MAKLTKKIKTGPLDKGFYAWTSLYAGSFLLFVEEANECYTFVFLPGPSYMYLTKETFDKCVATKVLEFVEVVPDEIFDETVALAKNNVEMSDSFTDNDRDEKHTKKL